MEKVADIFDEDKDGFIDYYEFVGALHPNKELYKPATDADKIEDEVQKHALISIFISILNVKLKFCISWW